MIPIRPPLPRRGLLDTSGYYALLYAPDRHHAAVRAEWDRFTLERWTTFTTNFIVAETHALLLTRAGYHHAVTFLGAVRGGATTIVRVTPADELRAEAIIFQYADKRFSYTDATSFAIMERLRIGTALTLDHNFAQYGFEVRGPA